MVDVGWLLFCDRGCCAVVVFVWLLLFLFLMETSDTLLALMTSTVQIDAPRLPLLLFAVFFSGSGMATSCSSHPAAALLGLPPTATALMEASGVGTSVKLLSDACGGAHPRCPTCDIQKLLWPIGTKVGVTISTIISQMNFGFGVHFDDFEMRVCRRGAFIVH